MKWNWKIPNTMIAIGLVAFAVCIFCNKLTEYLAVCIGIANVSVAVICFSLPSVMEKSKNASVWLNTKRVSMWLYPLGVVAAVTAIAFPIIILRR